MANRLASVPLPGLSEYYRSYVNTYLYRDIRNLSQVADETAFHDFMIVVAARTAKPVVYEDMAKDAGISQPTAKKLMHFLDTGLCA